MNFYFPTKVEVHVYMFGHVYGTIDELPARFDKKDSRATPEGNDIFNEGNKKKISEKQKEQFNTIASKGLDYI